MLKPDHLDLFRRHLRRCPHSGRGNPLKGTAKNGFRYRDASRAYWRCQCPIGVTGKVNGQRINGESLRTCDWEQAQLLRDKWVATGKKPDAVPTAEEHRTTIDEAWGAFIADATARNLKPPTLYKYQLLKRQMLPYAAERGLCLIAECDLTFVRGFRASWKQNSISATKMLERLRSFLRFCVESGWIHDNSAKKLKPPKTTAVPTLPFTRQEYSQILAACDQYAQAHPKAGAAAALRLRAFVQVMRHGGLAIRDTVTLHRSKVQDGKLFLRRAKTGVVVRVPLPPAVTELLDALPTTGGYFFWTGESKPKSAVGDWQRTLRRLFRLAEVEGGHAHRFRDTFAVELLLAGVPLERVSVLLGHQSTKVTERHYAPWVAARQEQLEQDVRRTWTADVVAGAGSVARELRGQKSELVN